MTEVSYFWDGTTGDGGSYGHAELMDTFFRVITTQDWPSLYTWDEDQGVLKNWLNELEVSDGGGLNVDVATGAAMVYGMFYESDAVETLAVPDDTSRYIVVQRSWAAQTVRLAVVAALTQTADVTWDIPLAYITTVGGNVTSVLDWREFCRFSTDLQDGAVDTDALADGAVGTAALVNQARWIAKGAGRLKPDADTPATWGTGGPYANYPNYPRWHLGSHTGSEYESIWLTTKAPEDLTGTTCSVYLWLAWPHAWLLGNFVVGWNAWVGESGAAFALQSNSETINSYPGPYDNYAHREYLGTITITSDSLIHLEVYRDQSDVADTMNSEVSLLQVELEYVADS